MLLLTTGIRKSMEETNVEWEIQQFWSTSDVSASQRGNAETDSGKKEAGNMEPCKLPLVQINLPWKMMKLRYMIVEVSFASMIL